jgi:hypothetical protein
MQVIILSDCDNLIDRELFLEKFEKLSLKVEQLTEQIAKMKHEFDKSNKINRSFGLEAIRNSEPLSFTNEINGVGSPSKRYIFSIRAVSELWKGRKNDILFTIRQQEKETHADLKALGIRIPINQTKNFQILTKEILSLLYVSCELNGLEINDILRETLSEINAKRNEMIQEIKTKLNLPTH